MFNCYKTKDNEVKNKYYYKYLNILRLDRTEKNLFDYRFIDNKLENNEELENIFKNNKDKTLKNIAFISNDFSLSRPSGILCKDFFNKLLTLDNEFNIFLVSKFSIKYPYNKFKNCFHSKIDSSIINHIKNNNIDILIDMQGHMCKNYNDLLSKRLAPIQIHFLGYPGTIGIPNIDYLIADKTIIPNDSCKFYREKIAYMPNCYQVNSESNLIDKTFNSQIFKFCNFNTHYKFDKKLIFVWIDILKKVPNSYLYLNKGNLEKTITKIASYNGVENRIIFLKLLSHKYHLKRVSSMDLGLDSYRLNGHTTSSDLICSGVPLITYSSDTYQNRVSKSILKSLDLEELVCYSYNDYIDLAVKIATDKQYHTNLIKKIKNLREKTLFNSTLYAKNFTTLLYNIWDHHFKNFITENQFAITNFGNNKKNQNYTWNYIPYVKINFLCLDNNSKRDLIKIVNCRGQILRDIADNISDCYLFTTSGLLFKDNSTLKTKFIKSKNYNDGIWYKNFYKKGFIEKLDLQQYNNINKDYNLPIVLIILNVTLNVSYKKIIEYLVYQSYLNTKLVIYYSPENFKKVKFLGIKTLDVDYEILSEEKVNQLIKKDNKSFKLVINESNFNKILNNPNYIKEALEKNPDNFMIL